MEPLSCYILNLFSHGAVESMWLRSRGLFNSIKRNTFSYYLDSVAEIQQRLFKSLFVSNPWLFYPFSSPRFPSVSLSLSWLNLCVYAESVLASPHTLLSLALSLLPVHHIALALGRIHKFWGKQVRSGSRMRGPGLMLSECSVSLSHSRAPPSPVCLSPPSRRESKEISSSQPCLRGVWLQRKESEEVGRGAYSSDRSNWEGNTDNTEWM